MIGAALFLTTRMFKNRVVRALARLRQPRYAAGAVVIVAYFWMVFFRRHAQVRVAGIDYGGHIDIILLVLSIVSLVILIGIWALPGDSPGLVFSEAEIQFLFAAPLSRRQLLAYKTIRSQARGIVSAIIFSLFVFRGGNAFGIWLVFAAFDHYARFAAFARARLRLAGIGWGARMVACAGALAALWAIASRQIAALSAMIVSALQHQAGPALLQGVIGIAWKPPLGTILAFPRLIVTSIYAAAPSLKVESWLVLIAASIALFFLTTALDVSFEDASIVASQRALVRRARRRGSRSGTASGAMNHFPPPFKLAPTGRPEVAVVWKNLIGALRMSSFPIFLFIGPLALAALASIFHAHAELALIMAAFGFASAGLLTFTGPQALRSDLRLDILRLDLIKTYPMTAEALLAAELAAPLLLISCAELLLLGVSIGILNFGGRPFPFLTSPEFVVTVLVLVVPVCAIQLLIQNAAMILVPAWTTTPSDSGGFTFMGQRLLMILANALALALALIPAAIVFFPSLLLAGNILGNTPTGVLLATLPAVAVLVIEIGVAHRLLASQLDDIDLANDLDMAAAS